MKKPTIRFKAFDGEWVEKKIIDIAPLQRGFDLPNSQLKPGSVPVVCSNGIVAYHNTSKCKAPGLVTGRSGTIGKFTLISEGDYWPHNTSLWVTDFKKNLPVFISYLYQTIQIEKYATGSGVPTLNRNDVHEHKCFISIDMSEQAAIGSFFKNLDSLIEGKRIKLDKLKKLKQAYLSKMFPKKGSRVPEVRFKGFTGDWKEIEFGSILEECLDRSTQENEDTLLSSSIEGMFLNSELFGHQRGASNKGYRKLQRNMLVLSAQNLHLGNANVNLRFDHGLVSPAYKIYFIKECSPVFLSAWIKKEETKHFFLMATTEGASGCRKNVEWDYLYKQRFFIPACVEEQVQIGAFFQTLDNLINLQEKELDKLTNIKSACLSKMFA